jgi:hypothetical protein
MKNYPLLIKRYAMKVYGGSEVTAPQFWKSVSDENEWTVLHPGHLTLQWVVMMRIVPLPGTGLHNTVLLVKALQVN